LYDTRVAVLKLVQGHQFHPISIKNDFQKARTVHMFSRIDTFMFCY